MAWNCYLAIFKAKSPVHIGYKQIGILKTTRYYITGRAMWGAITANLTRALFDTPYPKDYEVVGNFVKENIRTTYFYPAVKEENMINVETDFHVNLNESKFGIFIPNYDEDGLKFGNILKEEFEQIFIGSFVSTALEVGTKTAEEGSLHEFEFIKDKIKIDNKILNVYWIGYLFVKENVKNDKLKIDKCEEKEVRIKRVDTSKTVGLTQALDLVQVGGERNYGLGRLKLISNGFQKITNASKIFGKYDIELNNKDPILKNLDENSATAIAHVKLDGVELVLGEIEPIVGLEWSDKGAGQKVSDAKICATPGSKLKSGDFILCSYGMLRRTQQ